MKVAQTAVVSVTLGAAFGAATALVNWLSTPADAGGSPIAGTALEPLARLASLILDSGWAWAGLAVGVGWLAGGRVRAAVAGALALLAATTAYSQGADLRHWAVACVVLGPILGAVGASIRRPGVVGLLASLVVPAGAAMQMLVLPPAGSGATWARGIVLAAAAVTAGTLVARFVAVPEIRA